MYRGWSNTCNYTCNYTCRSGMTRKLTITIDEDVYNGLYRVVGPRRISRFIEKLVRPHVVSEDLSEGYAAMAQEETREAEALEWSESMIGDVNPEADDETG